MDGPDIFMTSVMPQPSGMAGPQVTVNATGSKLYNASNTSASYTGLTVAAGSNSAIVALLMVDNGGSISGLSMIWDAAGANQALTSIVTSLSSRGCAIFALAGEHGAPATGNKTLTASWTGSVPVFMAAMAFDGVNQTGGATSFPNSVSGGGTATVTVTSASGNKVIACETSGAGQGTSTGTLIFDDHVSGVNVNAMCQYDAGAASVSIGNTGANTIIVACDILAG